MAFVLDIYIQRGQWSQVQMGLFVAALRIYLSHELLYGYISHMN